MSTRTLTIAVYKILNADGTVTKALSASVARDAPIFVVAFDYVDCCRSDSGCGFRSTAECMYIFKSNDGCFDPGRNTDRVC